jgi:hypothetical protein
MGKLADLHHFRRRPIRRMDVKHIGPLARERSDNALSFVRSSR